MDGVDEAEGHRVQMIENDERKLLYTSFFKWETNLDLVSFGFGLFLVIFGIVGYLSTGSLISLIASILISIPIFVGSYLTVKFNFYWSILTLISTLILLVMMLQRTIKPMKYYPSGFILTISFLVATFLVIRLVIFWKK